MDTSNLEEFDFETIEEAGAIRAEIKRVQQRGRMNVINFIGLPGTGKSWACLRLAELLAQDFHGDKYKITPRNVVSDLLGLLKFIRSIKRDHEIVVCEEIGVWLSSRRAMSAENVDAGFVWDTLRKKRVIVITNNPISKHVDSKLLTISSMVVETLSLNKKEGICTVKPLRMQTNPSTAKTYRHRLHHQGFEVHRCLMTKPSEELTDAYEEGKDSFLDKLYLQLQEKHQAKIDKEIGRAVVPSEMIPTKLEKERFEMSQSGMTITRIAEIHGVDHSAVSKAITKYKAKIDKLKNEIFV